MGKVIINKPDATETARSSDKSPAGQKKYGRSLDVEKQVSVRRELAQGAQSVGVKMSTKSKSAAKPEAKSTQKSLSSTKKAAGTKVPVNQKDKEMKPKPKSTSKALVRLPATTKPQVKILESTKVGQAGAGKAGRNVDPELALMASRSALHDDVVRTNGKSMSGMVPRSRRPVRPNGASGATVRATAITNSQNAKNNSPNDEDLRFSKSKSMLIGVGVAAVVAIIGFVCIGIFGGGKNMCTVHFESNGGTQVEGTEIVCGRTVKQPEAPTKEGFSFEGWMLEGDPFDFATGLYKNTTLVARWSANEGTEIVKVKFDTDGGSKIDEIELAKGSKLRLSTTPRKAGYTFDDWYYNDKVYDFDEPVTQDMTLKAKWIKNATPSNNRPNNNQNNNNNNNGSNSANNEKEDDKKDDEKEDKPQTKVTSLSVRDLTLKAGGTTEISVTVLPSSADYSLVVNVLKGEDKVACSVGEKNQIACTASAEGEATVRVRDVNSGVYTTFKVTVPHEHIFVDGKCACGEKDPNYQPPEQPTPPAHEHVDADGDGKCDECQADMPKKEEGDGEKPEEGGNTPPEAPGTTQ